MIDGIVKILKIKRPFLMVDRIVNFKKNKSCTGYKKVNLNDWFLSHTLLMSLLCLGHCKSKPCYKQRFI